MRKVWSFFVPIVLGLFCIPNGFALQLVMDESDDSYNDYLDDSYGQEDDYDYDNYRYADDGYRHTGELDFVQYSYREGSKKKRSAAAVESNRSGTGRRVFIFNPRTLRWAVYDGSGNFVRSGHGSGGRGYCPDVRRSCRTPSGSYSVISKAGAGFRSSRYPLPGGGAPMPYAIFFSKYYAIHGSNDVPGYNASHGCIRVYPSDARWLNHEFLQHGSTVIVRPY